jgi:hypothetical protein
MLVWGWRIPFLLSVVTLLVAAILRYNMPESAEFTMSQEEMNEDYRARHTGHTTGSTDAATVTTGTHCSENGVEEGTTHGAAQTQRYTPLVELFRGYWSGLLLHSCYGCCEYQRSYDWSLDCYLPKTCADAVAVQMCLAGQFQCNVQHWLGDL